MTKENGDRISVIKIVADIEKLDAFLEVLGLFLMIGKKNKKHMQKQKKK